ncbi:Phosphate ABC transporter, permease protein PstC [Magnetospirillum gryphiswaldense MSR-1 v2]|uniref:Phosphate transport system permease protein n=1 Tax=Magnetospirillum gryphiswaldense (strain DSM 6361 / JCM 21280 / NBRC 15271 / MSR-1) TaxID=431944 RepID=V6EX72_MAGGM|nr:phosphate ABC transporter permease subunit PstC [Magnetospirillum gryphiswaldense]CDK97774.1 Phosphate ABC transporter, permease protein PstC [Magnetospirillum gryphiswaldense MSR-1 v2]
MQLLTLMVVLLLLTTFGYRLGRNRALASASGNPRLLHSLPSYHGYYVALWCGLPALFVIIGWLMLEPAILHGTVMSSLPADLQSLPEERLALVYNEVRNVARHGHVPSNAAVGEAAQHYTSLRTTMFFSVAVASLAVAVAALAFAHRRIHTNLRARNRVEAAVKVFLVAASTVAIFTTIGIVLSLLFESLRFFQTVSLFDFLFGTQWSPQMAIRADQVGSSGAFGAVPLFAGTLLISGIAMLVAVPLGLLSAIYMSEYAAPKFRSVVKPLLEVLAGIPTVVYGFFAALTVAPFIRDMGAHVGLSVASESALAAGLVMGIMIIPFVSSLSDDVITAVPQSLREGSYGLGATKSETIRQVVIPAALPGIVGGVLLAASRAIGETMIVVMAAGLAANLTANPLEAVTTVTTQIVTLLVGDQEFDSPKTLAAFALGLVLFTVTLALNVVALHIVNKYREKYD